MKNVDEIMIVRPVEEEDATIAMPIGGRDVILSSAVYEELRYSGAFTEYCEDMMSMSGY